METLTAQFAHQIQVRAHKTALLEHTKDGWVSQSFKEWETRSRAIAAALITDGVAPDDGVAVFSYSRREWLEADMGILMTKARCVTVYQNLGKETVTHILADSRAKIVFAEGPIQLQALLDADGRLPEAVSKVIYFQNRQIPLTRPGKPPSAELSLSEVLPPSQKDRIVSYTDYVAKGQELLSERYAEVEARINDVSPDTVARIVYTSGTTGKPKGTLLTHGGLTAVTQDLERTVGLRSSDVTLLFLPLAHVYAQLVYHAQLRIGFQIGFARSMLTAVDDAASLKPDFFVSVPRLFEKIYATVLSSVDSGSPVKKWVFNYATEVGTQVSRRQQHQQPLGKRLGIKAAIANKLVFSKLKNRLGGKVRVMISGGAPLSREISEFFHAAGLLILEGYGMTENSSLSHHNRVNDYRFGSVGKPLDNTEVLIADDGEILVRGPQLMKGYHNMPDDTAETIDSGGWLHTGDVGIIDDDGFLRITDRKKDLIVTSGGKNVAPAPIESALCNIKLVSQAVVLGNGRKFLCALLTLNPEELASLAEKLNLQTGGQSLHTHPSIHTVLESEIARVNNRLERYETIKRFAVAPREFSIADGEVTPSLKLRKKIIEQKYKPLLDSLYE